MQHIRVYTSKATDGTLHQSLQATSVSGILSLQPILQLFPALN